MPSTDPQMRLDRAYTQCRPRSAAGSQLLDRYYTGVQFDRGGVIPEWELGDFYEACRIADEFSGELTLERLEERARMPDLSVTAARRRRRVISRLVKLLEQDGLPSRAERRANQRTHEFANALPSPLRERVRGWLALRSQTLGWQQLAQEASRIVQLEQIAALNEAWHPGEVISAWLAAVIRPVVKCQCPPVTRAIDPTRCTSCGATIEEVGSRPAPGPRKQDELRSLGRRYLAWRDEQWSAA